MLWPSISGRMIALYRDRELASNPPFISIDFLVSLLKKNWKDVRSLHIKATTGKPVRLF
ncbi:hypothetical protein EV715DRAFT_298336 [Schizophyllum commune]